MFAKLFGLKKTEPNSFRVELRIPISWDSRKKFAKEGRYPNAVLTLRPGMTEAEVAAHIKASGTSQSMTDIFWGPTAQAVRLTFDEARVLRNIFFGDLISDDVVVQGLQLRAPLATAKSLLPGLTLYVPDFMRDNILHLPQHFTYYKTTSGGLDIDLVVKDEKIHGITLRTVGWKPNNESNAAG